MIASCFRLAGMWGVAAAILGAAGAPDVAPSGFRRITTVVRPDGRTGKLVRRVIVTSTPVAERGVAQAVAGSRVVAPVGPGAPAVLPEPPAGIVDAVEQAAARYALSPQLIHSVIKVESNYNPYAISTKGAQGLMQLIPATARRFGVANVFNPVENIQGGAKYLKHLLDLFNGDYPLALAAYNAGEAAVARYGAVPPYAETQNYVRLVARQLEKSAASAAAMPARPAAAPAPADPAGANHIQEVVEPDGSVRYVSR